MSLGLPEDSRDFSDATTVLRYLLSDRPIRLLSNNPRKRKHPEVNGRAISESLALLSRVNDSNIRYLRAKRSKGHQLPEEL